MYTADGLFVNGNQSLILGLGSIGSEHQVCSHNFWEIKTDKTFTKRRCVNESVGFSFSLISKYHPSPLLTSKKGNKHKTK